MAEKKTSELKEQMLDRVEKYRPADTQDPSKSKNTPQKREKLIRIIHDCHILRMMGDIPSVTEKDRDARVEMEMLLSRSDAAAARHDTLRLRVIDEHSDSWHIARYYYERASKSYCQMLATLLDATLGYVAGGLSLLYAADNRKAFFLTDELRDLAKTLVSSCCYLCVYDYCTLMLGKELGMPEYAAPVPEHERIALNGLPAKLRVVSEGYTKISSVDVELNECLLNPEKLYDEKLLTELYEQLVMTGEYPGCLYGFGDSVKLMDTQYSRIKLKEVFNRDGRLFDLA